jgi:hypothetical protein
VLLILSAGSLSDVNKEEAQKRRKETVNYGEQSNRNCLSVVKLSQIFTTTVHIALRIYDVVLRSLTSAQSQILRLCFLALSCNVVLSVR